MSELNNQADKADLDLDDILDKMKDPRMQLDIRDRTKGLRTIKRSIIGSNFVDWLIDNNFTITGSRLEALAICTALLNTYAVCCVVYLEWLLFFFAVLYAQDVLIAFCAGIASRARRARRRRSPSRTLPSCT